MGDLAYAVRISPINYQAIISEARASLNIDLKFINDWVRINGSGYFVRDVYSPLDCCFIPEDNFSALYRFKHEDKDSMFREIERFEPEKMFDLPD